MKQVKHITANHITSLGSYIRCLYDIPSPGPQIAFKIIEEDDAYRGKDFIVTNANYIDYSIDPINSIEDMELQLYLLIKFDSYADDNIKNLEYPEVLDKINGFFDKLEGNFSAENRRRILYKLASKLEWESSEGKLEKQSIFEGIEVIVKEEHAKNIQGDENNEDDYIPLSFLRDRDFNPKDRIARIYEHIEFIKKMKKNLSITTTIRELNFHIDELQKSIRRLKRNILKQRYMGRTKQKIMPMQEKIGEIKAFISHLVVDMIKVFFGRGKDIMDIDTIIEGDIIYQLKYLNNWRDIVKAISILLNMGNVSVGANKFYIGYLYKRAKIIQELLYNIDIDKGLFTKREKRHLRQQKKLFEIFEFEADKVKSDSYKYLVLTILDCAIQYILLNYFLISYIGKRSNEFLTADKCHLNIRDLLYTFIILFNIVKHFEFFEKGYNKFLKYRFSSIKSIDQEEYKKFKKQCLFPEDTQNKGYFFTKNQFDHTKDVTKLGLFNEYIENTTKTFLSIISQIIVFRNLSLLFKFNKFTNITKFQNQIAKFFVSKKSINNLLLRSFVFSIIFNYIKLGYEYQITNETDPKASKFKEFLDAIYPKKLFAKAIKNSRNNKIMHSNSSPELHPDIS